MTIGRVVCASPDYFQARGTPAHPSDLRDHNCLTYGFLSTGNQWKLSGKDGDHWIQPPWTLCVNNAEVLRDAAIAGRGIALVPTFIAAHALQAGRLATCLDTYQAPPLALYALYPPTRHLAVKVRLRDLSAATKQAGNEPGRLPFTANYENANLLCAPSAPRNDDRAPASADQST
jgi:DNA-binding transcriptional LysR family regulator